MLKWDLFPKCKFTINTIHINKIKDKNMILINAEKAFDKVQHIHDFKKTYNSQQIRNRRKYNLIKGINGKT